MVSTLTFNCGTTSLDLPQLNFFNSVLDTQATPGIVPVTITAGNLGMIGSFFVADSAFSFDNVGGTVIGAGSGGIPAPNGFFIGEYNTFGVKYENTEIHTAGAAVTISDFVQNFYVDPAATLAILVITMPNPIDLQEVKISFGGTITLGAVVVALSIVGAGGDTILDGGAITTANAGDGYIFKYDAIIGAWRLF
jgi:hypothetical protein